MPQLASDPTLLIRHLAEWGPAAQTIAIFFFFPVLRGNLFFSELISSICPLPLRSHSCHGVNAHKHGGDGEPVLKPAELLPKVPDVVAGVDEVEDGVEGGHQQVRKSQVHDEVIGSGPHPPVRQDDPDDGDVANDGCDNDEGVGDGPQGNPPSWLAELGHCRPVATVLEGASLGKVARVKNGKRAHGFSLLVSVKENRLASAHFLAVGAVV